MFELYEDNAGGLHMYQLDATGAPVWAMTYTGPGWDRAGGPEWCAAQDWCACVVDYSDPAADGWETDADALAAYPPDARQIASSDWGSYPLGVDVSECAVSGHVFAESLGVLKVCPSCGAEVKADYIPSAGALRYPLSCPFCGEAMY